MTVSERREAALAELARAPYDLLVVGGGIIGAGIASEAARRGLRVALLDRSDFGGATSSASSKLIHGGLRYLRLGDVKLVREAHTERRALLRVVAPHLVRRIPFLFPVYRGGPYRPATIQAGLWTYSTLAGEKLGGLVRPERAARSVPPLKLNGLRGCGVYQDAWTHDERLCLANVTAAAEAGATVLNYAEVVELRTRLGPCRRRRGPRSVRRRGRLRRRPGRRERDRAVARDPAPARGARHRAVRATVEGCPRDAPARRAVVGRSDDPARPGPRHVRVSVGGDAPARYDGHALRGRSGRRGRDGGGRRPGARGGGRRGRRRAAPSRPRPLDVCRSAGAPRPRRHDGRCPPRDGVPARPRGHAHGRGREADDVPPHRARRAPGALHRARARSRSTGAPSRFPAPPTQATLPPASSRAGRWSRPSRRISPTSTARAPTASSRSPPTGRRCSSGCTRTPRTSPRRPSSPRRRSGRRAPPMSSTAAPPSAPAGLRERRSPDGSATSSRSPPDRGPTSPCGRARRSSPSA